MREKIAIITIIITLMLIVIYLSLFINKPNKPILFDNMIPVYYEDNKIIYANENNKWYDYDKKKWANAIVLNKNSKQYKVGEEIKMDDIDMMYVWIPRFEYKLESKPEEINPKPISIKFVNGKRNMKSNEYEIHSAFQFGDKKLTGFWASKFELGYIDENCEDKKYAICSDIENLLRLKPEVKSMKYKSIKELFDLSKNISKTYSMNNDSHMIKNSEWGAIAYFTNSKYGRCNEEKCEEISKNDSHLYTGKSQGADEALKNSNPNGTYNYDEKKGLKASTTKNLYGIYDLSGGHDEYVMGNYKNIISKSGFDKMPEKKYYDMYEEKDLKKLDSDHALDKTRGWFNDLHNYVNEDLPWLIRGGFYDCPKFAGVFGFGNKDGRPAEMATTRVILTELED